MRRCWQGHISYRHGKHFLIFLKIIFDCQGNDTSKPKANQTSCQIEITNLETVLSMAETVQAEDIDHSADGAAYIGKVTEIYIITL